MKTKYFITLIIFSFLTINFIILTGDVLAQEMLDIQYPVEELGNCENQEACKSYCDKPENLEACIDFAERHNLMSPEEIEMAKKFLAAGGEGPGGCRGKEECEEYCNDINHIDECISFAEENGLIPPEELEEAKKVQAAIRSGINPPPCGNKRACDIYCEEPEHMEECIAFAEAAGFLQGKELEDAQKMLAAVKRGVKPPPCKGKEACDEYCSNPDNMEACMTFALEAGFMNEQEKADAQKMLAAIKKGVKPPNCRGKEECDVYCSQEEHFEECLNFAEAAGFMTPEDAAMARKTGGKGPGGCKGKEECEAFCKNPANQEICFNFAKEHGLIPEEDLKKMEEGRQKFKESLEQAPPAVLDCLTSQVGAEMMEKFKSGTAMPTPEIGDKMRECFEKTMGPMGPMGPGGPEGGPGMVPEGQTGPGGCKTPDECKTYCEANPEECKNFQPPSGGPEGQMPPEGQIPPEGQMPPPPEGQMPPEGMIPPEGMMPPPEGQIPPEGMVPPEGTQFQQPPEGAPSMPPEGQQAPPPPPESTPPPESPPQSFFDQVKSFLGSIIDAFSRF